MYLNQIQQVSDQDPRQADPYAVAALQQQQQSALAAQQTALYGGSTGELLNGSVIETPTTTSNPYSQAVNGPTSFAGSASGLLAPTNSRGQHSRAISLPAFSQEPFGNDQSQGQSLQPPTHKQQQNSFSGMSSGLGGFGNAGFGLAIGSTENVGRPLGGWAEEKIQ